jgi:hypothetical protein
LNPYNLSVDILYSLLQIVGTTTDRNRPHEVDHLGSRPLSRGAQAGGTAKSKVFDEKTRLQDPDYQRALALPPLKIDSYPAVSTAHNTTGGRDAEV